MNVETLAWALGIAGFLIVALGSIVAWFVQHSYLRMEKALGKAETEAAAREQKILGDVNALGGRLNTFEKEVTREYMTSRDLEAALRPLMDRLGRFELTLDRIWEKMDGKLDRIDHVGKGAD